MLSNQLPTFLSHFHITTGFYVELQQEEAGSEWKEAALGRSATTLYRQVASFKVLTARSSGAVSLPEKAGTSNTVSTNLAPG